MGRKINPNAIRIGINKTWSSRWYAEKKDFPKSLKQDLLIKSKVNKSMKDAGVDSVEVKRSLNQVEIIAYVAKPGVAIGRGKAIQAYKQINKENGLGTPNFIGLKEFEMMLK